MTDRVRAYRRLSEQWVSAVGRGLILELIPADEEGRLWEQGPVPVAAVLEDDAGEKWIQLYPEAPIQVPVTELRRLLDRADQDVHNEAHYPYPGDDA